MLYATISDAIFDDAGFPIFADVAAQVLHQEEGAVAAAPQGEDEAERAGQRPLPLPRGGCTGPLGGKEVPGLHRPGMPGHSRHVPGGDQDEQPGALAARGLPVAVAPCSSVEEIDDPENFLLLQERAPAMMKEMEDEITRLKAANKKALRKEAGAGKKEAARLEACL